MEKERILRKSPVPGIIQEIASLSKESVVSEPRGSETVTFHAGPVRKCVILPRGKMTCQNRPVMAASEDIP